MTFGDSENCAPYADAVYMFRDTPYPLRLRLLTIPVKCNMPRDLILII